MRNIFFAAMLSVFSLSAMMASPASSLLKRLKKINKAGIMVGHQDATMYGTTWAWDKDRGDVYEITGDQPAIMGFDLGHMENDSPVNLDSVPFTRIKEEIVKQYNRGGIVTLSWHPDNPVTGKSAWDPSGKVLKNYFEGGVAKQKLDSWLGKVASFINSLKTTKGVKIPVIFRPWHEMNGGWFWWGKNSRTVDEYKQFYVLTHDYLTKAGCNNIVWAWSPNLGNEKSVGELLSHYPGDKYVDIIGVDIYEFDNDDKAYQKNLTTTLNVLTEAAKQTGKIAALSETGCRGIQQKTKWFTETLWPVLKNYQLSYVLFWRNDYKKPEMEAYLPGKNDPSAPDFKAFYDLKETLFAKDIKRIK